MAHQVVKPPHGVGSNYPDQFRHESFKFYIALSDLHQIPCKLFFPLIPNGIGPKKFKIVVTYNKATYHGCAAIIIQ